MMVLYSGTTCPFSQRCRLVLFEKGMDFEIRDVDLFNKPEDISTMNPYGQVPILVERELILYESNIITEYIAERFPHPQLMPADPLMRARARAGKRTRQEQRQGPRQGTRGNPRPPDDAGAAVPEKQVHAGRRILDARRGCRAAAVAPGPLRHRTVEDGCTADEIRRTHLLASGLYRSADAFRKGHAPLRYSRQATLAGVSVSFELPVRPPHA